MAKELKYSADSENICLKVSRSRKISSDVNLAVLAWSDIINSIVTKSNCSAIQNLLISRNVFSKDDFRDEVDCKNLNEAKFADLLLTKVSQCDPDRSNKILVQLCDKQFTNNPEFSNSMQNALKKVAGVSIKNNSNKGWLEIKNKRAIVYLVASVFFSVSLSLAVQYFVSGFWTNVPEPDEDNFWVKQSNQTCKTSVGNHLGIKYKTLPCDTKNLCKIPDETTVVITHENVNKCIFSCLKHISKVQILLTNMEESVLTNILRQANNVRSLAFLGNPDCLKSKVSNFTEIFTRQNLPTLSNLKEFEIIGSEVACSYTDAISVYAYVLENIKSNSLESLTFSNIKVLQHNKNDIQQIIENFYANSILLDNVIFENVEILCVMFEIANWPFNLDKFILNVQHPLSIMSKQSLSNLFRKFLLNSKINTLETNIAVHDEFVTHVHNLQVKNVKISYQVVDCTSKYLEFINKIPLAKRIVLNIELENACTENDTGLESISYNIKSNRTFLYLDLHFNFQLHLIEKPILKCYNFTQSMCSLKLAVLDGCL